MRGCYPTLAVHVGLLSQIVNMSCDGSIHFHHPRNICEKETVLVCGIYKSRFCLVNIKISEVHKSLSLNGRGVQVMCSICGQRT